MESTSMVAVVVVPSMVSAAVSPAMDRTDVEPLPKASDQSVAERSTLAPFWLKSSVAAVSSCPSKMMLTSVPLTAMSLVPSAMVTV